MPEFRIQCDYSGKRKMKFFNDKEPKEYHAFLVNNVEVVPNEYLYFVGNKQPCWILIFDDLVKKAGIDFGNPYGGGINEYEFIINLGKNKTAKFNTNNSNKMVLKTKDYWENTVKKIGFWNNKNYFYESKKMPEKTNQPKKKQTQSENRSDWGKIALVCLPIIIVALFFFLIVSGASKKNK